MKYAVGWHAGGRGGALAVLFALLSPSPSEYTKHNTNNKVAGRTCVLPPFPFSFPILASFLA